MSRPFKFFDHEISGSSSTPVPDRFKDLTPFFADAPPAKTETLIAESNAPAEDLTEGMDLPAKRVDEDEILADLIRNHPNNLKK